MPSLPLVTYPIVAYAIWTGILRRPVMVVLSAALLSALPALAVEPAGDESPTTWGLGIGAGSKQKPYAGIERHNEVLPLIEFENKYVRVLGPALEAKLPSFAISDTQSLNFRLVARYALFGGYEADDAPILAGMEERKDGVWVGAKIDWKNSLVNVSTEWLHDVSGYSKGQRFSLGLDKRWHFGKQMMFIPRVGAVWHDGKYNDFYFGVRETEARPDRPAYRAGAGLSAELGLRSIYMFDRHHSMMADFTMTSLSTEVKDSPLVDRSSENRFFLAYVYRF